MPVNILVENIEKYVGKYVATKSFKNKKVISYGNNPLKVYKEAKKKV